MFHNQGPKQPRNFKEKEIRGFLQLLVGQRNRIRDQLLTENGRFSVEPIKDLIPNNEGMNKASFAKVGGSQQGLFDQKKALI